MLPRFRPRPVRDPVAVIAFLLVLAVWQSIASAADEVSAEAADIAFDRAAAEAAVPSQPSQELTLEAAVAEAVENNPGLGEMQSRAQALATIPSQVGTLPDPALNLNATNLPVDTFDLDQEAMTQIQVGLTQAIPFPGKLGLRARAARHEAAASFSEVEEARLRLVRNVEMGWWNLFYLDRALETVSRNQDLLRQLIKIAETKYEVGQGLQQDVLLAQVELSKLLELEIRLQGTRRNEEARLDALLDRPADAPIRLPQDVDKELPEVPPESVLMQTAEANRPLLLARQERVSAARARHELAERDYYPDFTLGAAYGFRQGSNPLNGRERPDFFTAKLSVTLPLYMGRKQDKAVEQRLAEIRERRLALDDDRSRVGAEVSIALADFRRAQDQVVLLETGIVPQARQTVESMRAGYLVNKVDFLNLVRAQITVYDYETQYWKALAEAKQALAALAAAVGKEVAYE